MGEIMNLRRARKARARDAAVATATARRAQYGRTKQDVAAARAEADRIARQLDGAKRTDESPDPAE